MTGPQNLQIQPVLNTPSKPQSVGAVTGQNQKDRRYTDTFHDMHRNPRRFPIGRPWCGPRELAANRDSVPPPQDGFCVGDLMQGEYVEDEFGNCDRGATLAGAWNAPWVPVAKYFRFNYKMKRITFDYAKMRMEEAAQMKVYYKAAAKLGAKLNIRVQEGIEPDFQIVADIGSAMTYLNNMKLADAAMAGDPWLLGFIDEPNPVLAEILGFNAAGLQLTSYTPPPIATPAQVLATPEGMGYTDMMKMIAEMSAQAVTAALRAEREEQAAKKVSRSDAIKAGIAKKKERAA